jgi:hypothetical protein
MKTVASECMRQNPMERTNFLWGLMIGLAVMGLILLVA